MTKRDTSVSADTSDANPDTVRSDPNQEAVSRRKFIAAAGVGGAAALTGCLEGVTGSGATETPNPETSLRFQWYRNHTTTFAPLTAAEKWSWPEYGVDVTVKESEGSKSAAKAVASGKNQFGMGGFGAVLQLIENGAPLTIIGSGMDPYGGVVSMAETDITSWKDLEGKTLGQFPWGSTGPVAKAAMREEGVDLSKVSFQNVQPGSDLKLLVEGKIDGAIRYTPQGKSLLAVDGHEANTLRSGKVLNHLGVALYARDNVIENKPDMVSNVVGGWLDGVEMWASDHDKVVEAHKNLVTSDYSRPWNEDFYKRLAGPMYAAYAPSEDEKPEKGKGYIPEERMQTTVDVFKDAGLLDEDHSVGDLYTNEFIEDHHDLAVDTREALVEALKSYDIGPDYV